MEQQIFDFLEYKVRKSDPDGIGHSLLNELAREVAGKAAGSSPVCNGWYGFRWKLREHEASKKILKSDPETQASVVRAIFDGRFSFKPQVREKLSIRDDCLLYDAGSYWVGLLSKLLNKLLINELPHGAEGIEKILRGVAGYDLTWNRHIKETVIIKCLKEYTANDELTEAMRESLRVIESKAKIFVSTSKQASRVFWIKEILGQRLPAVVDKEDRWAWKAIEDMKSMSCEERERWERFIRFTEAANGSKPTKKWLVEGQKHVDGVGEERIIEYITLWLCLARVPTKAGFPKRKIQELQKEIEDMDDEEFKKRTLQNAIQETKGPLIKAVLSNRIVSQLLSSLSSTTGHEFKQQAIESLKLDEEHSIEYTGKNSDVLKGLVWCCSLFDDESLNIAIGDLAEICFRKLPYIGPLSTKVGNACVYSLSAIASQSSVSQLSRLKHKVKYASAQKMISKAFERAAVKAGVSSEELEESSVVTFGLDGGGCLRKALGRFTAELRIVGGNKGELRWIKENGKVQKTVPVEVKRDYAGRVKELKKTVKDVTKELSSQRYRLERLILGRRRWEYEVWRQRYLDHPVVGALARRLIWRFGEGDKNESGIWLDGEVVGLDGRALEGLGDATRVCLWHPVEASVDEVQGWRRWLVEHEVCQPFKQAHREIYILTDAEQQTETYSNRFAAHILKQHQFTSLCQQRGWRYTLQGQWDSHNTPTLRLPEWDLWAEFWVDGVENDEASGVGIFLYVMTDQVRLYDGQRQQLALQDVPALVLSEVMRDVDLFVGVASVGNDPAWSDGGPEGRYRDYWADISFGDLTATAQTRKEVLEGLVSRLKIADRCCIEGKFLKVRGDIRTYKIHMGSGNILMEPNDQYLCIVAGRGMSKGKSAGKVFLPFEGDNTLSVILSKVFLLADDKKIKDPTIVQQIKR